MSDPEQAKSWWQTLPGLIAAVAGVITALTGLVVALGNTGWFKSPPPQAASKAPVSAEVKTQPAQPAPVPVVTPSPTMTASSAAASSDSYAIALPVQRDYKLRSGSGGYYTATLSLLEGKIEPATTEQAEFSLRMRMNNHFGGGVNFWDDWFRLVIDGNPEAPERGLNLMVDGHASKEGSVRFLIPKSLKSAVLRIQYYDGPVTDVPLNLGRATP